LIKENGLPLVAVLRDTQNYSIAMESGLGICELKPGVSAKDRQHWEPILDWLHEEIPSKQHVELAEARRNAWRPSLAKAAGS
jgi:chromosome partitioning protein